MFGIDRFYRLLRALVRKNLEDEMDSELRFHLDRQIEDYKKAGMKPEEARYLAMRSFGGMDQIKEKCRDVCGFRFLEELWQDLRYGVRMLRKNPGFTLVAVLTLALGIGANTAIFSLVDAVLLRTLPVADAEELVVFSHRTESRQDFPFATYQYHGLREGGEVLSGLCAFRPWPGIRVDVNGEAELAFGQFVSGNYYSVLGVRALVGRTLADYDDEAAGQHPVAMISHPYWQRRFGGDPGIVGKSIELQGQRFTIVGVTPRDFCGTEPGRAVEITVPLAMLPVVIPEMSRLAESEGLWLMLIGRLKQGISEEQAQASLSVLWARLLSKGSPGGEQKTPALELQSGAQGLNRLRLQFSIPLRILMAAVGLLLLIACANLAGLLLARSIARRHEIEIRLAVGAGRGRVMRQLLTESVLLSIIGGVFGAIMAYWTTDLLVSMLSRGTMPIALTLGPDLRAMAFTAAVSILTGLLFGVLPAVRVTRGEIQPGLRGGAPGVAGTRNRWAQGMVVTQVALSLLLLSGATMFMRSLRNLQGVDAGFRKDHVLLVSVRPSASGYQGDRARTLYKELTLRFSSAPGVQAVTLSMDTPLGGLSYAARISVPGRSPDNADARTPVYFNTVGPRFFETLGIPVLSGRDFNDRDDDRAPRVAVINESLARRYFRNDNPLGRRVLIGKEPVEIVGVAKDTRYQGLRKPGPQMIYRPYLQGDMGDWTFCIRTTSDPLSVIPVLRSEARSVARNLPFHSVKALEHQADAALVQERMLATLSSFFGALAVILAAVGLYGTMSYAVLQRSREIGVRMALGAKPSYILQHVLGEALRLVFAGLAIGSTAAWIAGRLGSSLISGLLFELKSTDSLTIVLATLLLLTVACVAGYLPARRAARVDPMVALRYE